VPNVYARTLKSAAQLTGGDEELARRLGVSRSELAAWMEGCGVPPLRTVLKAVDLITNGVAPAPRSPSWKLQLRAALWRLGAMCAMQRAR
jgi:transcriptional regulator with XRE-family HTH domain